jgi:TRAP-type C4-dicarboxylate transport system permease small subunit
MNTFAKTLEKFSDLLKILGGIALVAMMLLTVVDTVGRYFRYPVFGSIEIIGFLAAIVLTAALPYTYKLDGHVSVEVLVRLLPPKTQNIIQIIIRILTFVLFAFIAWQMVNYAQDLHKTGEVSMNLRFPLYYLAYLIAFGLFIFAITILETILKKFKQIEK